MVADVFESGQAAQDENSHRIAELERTMEWLARENEVLKNAESWREAHQRKNGR